MGGVGDRKKLGALTCRLDSISMLHNVIRFRSLGIALKEMERFVKDGRSLSIGRPFKQFGNMRPREVLGNLLICMVLNHEESSDHWTFTSDPTGDADGVIHNNDINESWMMEHVMIPTSPGQSKSNGEIENRILDCIQKKIAKGGDAYASGKQLVVFVDCRGGAWFPNKVSKQLPDPLWFASVWAFGLQEAIDGDYVYGVTQLTVEAGDAPSWIIRIGKSFGQWSVRRFQ